MVSSEQMGELLELSRTFSATVDLVELLPRVAVGVTRLLGCERASVFFHEPETDELWTMVALHNAQIRLQRGHGIAWDVFTSGQSTHVPDAYSDARFDRSNDQATGFRTRDIIAVPMFDLEKRAVGVLQAINSHDGFDEHEFSILQLIADQAAVCAQRDRMHRELLRSVELQREMQLAAQVQLEQLPRAMPEIRPLDCFGYSRPASVTGGDCFDLWRLPDGRLGILLADSAGHGLAAAMVAVQVRTLVRTLADEGHSPHAVLNKVNRHLASELSPSRFVTAVLGYLSTAGHLEFASAGHGPSLIKTSPTGAFEEVMSSGLPLVIDADLPIHAFEPRQIDAGGQLVLLSDGIFEAPAKSGEMLGIDRVRLSLQSQLNNPAADQAAHLRLVVRTWQGHDNPRDDQTVVVIRHVTAS